ncbi:outer membrane beta-barrel protein [Psychroserpens mesophilus]|uniref:outer membrane beta-barrel protein n=1 Tax=Psychroserpens mesophilus TaxID=325473 RepID=UPI000590BCFC|nr:outer membrane beta-barrel protein [Psychroserpens mesophilus]
MKKIICVLCFVLCVSFIQAQESYTVNGETIELKTEVEGQLDLLWNIIDGEYRYFVRTEDNTITELKNTKVDRKFQEEYKTLLNQLTNNSLSTKRLNLTLFSLKEFIDTYNISADSNYQTNVSRSKFQFRLGLFGGITNSPFITNPNNEKTPLFGAELEVLEAERISRHAVFMQLKHVLEQENINYSTTEVALGYRFRVINKETFSLYANMKFATLNFSKATLVTNTNGMITTQEFSDTAFDVPFIFGLGADINLSKNSFITLAYNELFALFLDNQGNFSTDFAIGYKFKL